MNSPTLLAPLQRLRRLCVLVISRKLSVLDSSVAVWPHDSHSSVSAVRLDAPYCLSFWKRRTRVARHDSWTNGTMMPSVELPQLPTSHWAMPKTDRSFHVTTMPSQVLRITYFFFFFKDLTLLPKSIECSVLVGSPVGLVRLARLSAGRLDRPIEIVRCLEPDSCRYISRVFSHFKALLWLINHSRLCVFRFSTLMLVWCNKREWCFSSFCRVVRDRKCTENRFVWRKPFCLYGPCIATTQPLLVGKVAWQGHRASSGNETELLTSVPGTV